MGQQYYTDIMIDIETLDTDVSAIVLSFGAVAFNAKRPGAGKLEMYRSFGSREYRHEQVKLGRTYSPETVEWWGNQSPEARKIFAEASDTHSVQQSLIDLQWLFTTHLVKNVNVWGNAPSFDCSVMSSLFKSYNTDVPWEYWSERCFRTMKAEHGHLIEKVKRQGVHHNALDDTLYQIEVLHRIYNKLQKSNLESMGKKK